LRFLLPLLSDFFPLFWNNVPPCESMVFSRACRSPHAWPRWRFSPRPIPSKFCLPELPPLLPLLPRPFPFPPFFYEVLNLRTFRFTIPVPPLAHFLFPPPLNLARPVFLLFDPLTRLAPELAQYWRSLLIMPPPPPSSPGPLPPFLLSFVFFYRTGYGVPSGLAMRLVFDPRWRILEFLRPVPSLLSFFFVSTLTTRVSL